ncbi:MAG: prepilin peptidase [Acidothermus sp.]|nr:prepilin peptidase [Acidothermus sp.]
MTNAWFVAAAAVVGAVVGSFLNVVIWRLPRGESVVSPGSYCPHCGKGITPRDNVPILSWLVLHGRCRACGAPISWRYPAVEALTAALFAGTAWRFGISWEIVPFLYLVAVGIALAWIDFDVRRLPNSVVLPSYLVASVLLSVAAVVEHHPERLLIAACGMAGAYGLFYLLMLVKPGGMGFGDVKLAGLLGLYLGFLGIGPLVVGFFLAFLLGGIAGVALLVARRASRRSKIPFGPALIAGALLAVFFGNGLSHFYTARLV